MILQLCLSLQNLPQDIVELPCFLKVLYKGTGASLITFGSRQSAIIPALLSASNTALPFSACVWKPQRPFSRSARGGNYFNIAGNCVLQIIQRNHSHAFSNFSFLDLPPFCFFNNIRAASCDAYSNNAEVLSIASLRLIAQV